MKRWLWWGRWFGAHWAIGALGLAGMVGLDQALTALKRWVFLQSPSDITLFLGLSGLWIGVLLGGGQGWALRGRGWGLGRWVLGSGLGSAFGLLGLWGLFWAIGPERLIPRGTAGLEIWAWVCAGIGLGIGLGAGVAQWILGWGLARDSWTWVVGSGLGGGLGGWGIGVMLLQLGKAWIERWEWIGWMGLGMVGGTLFAFLTALGLPADPSGEGAGNKA